MPVAGRHPPEGSDLIQPEAQVRSDHRQISYRRAFPTRAEAPVLTDRLPREEHRPLHHFTASVSGEPISETLFALFSALRRRTIRSYRTTFETPPETRVCRFQVASCFQPPHRNRLRRRSLHWRQLSQYRRCTPDRPRRWTPVPTPENSWVFLVRSRTLRSLFVQRARSRAA